MRNRRIQIGHAHGAGRRRALSIVDRANMLPHNYARHAVYPAGITKDFGLLGGKAPLLKDALGELGVEPAYSTPRRPKLPWGRAAPR